jgi:hypothetical protein
MPRSSSQALTEDKELEMALYLIAFNDEWVPDLTLEELRERGTSGRIAVAVGWPQEVHRFPHRALSAGAQSEALF